MKPQFATALRQDFRSSIVMTGFVALIAGLGLATSLSIDHAQTNPSLMSAIFGKAN